MSLAVGVTKDGWQYRVYWSEADGRFRVMFHNEFKEVWVLDEVEVRKVNDLFVVFVRGGFAGYPYFSRVEEAVADFARRLAYRLEHDGSAVVRGRRAKETGIPELAETVVVPSVLPFGRARLVMEKSTAVVPRPAAAALRRERVSEAPPVTPVTPAPAVPLKPLVREVYGLGSEGMRRLRVLFESTLLELGIKPTRELKVRAERVILDLEQKYKFERRDDAVERATVDFLKWVEKEVYFKR